MRGVLRLVIGMRCRTTDLQYTVGRVLNGLDQDSNDCDDSVLAIEGRKRQIINRIQVSDDDRFSGDVGTSLRCTRISRRDETTRAITFDSQPYPASIRRSLSFER